MDKAEAYPAGCNHLPVPGKDLAVPVKNIDPEEYLLRIGREYRVKSTKSQPNQGVRPGKIKKFFREQDNNRKEEATPADQEDYAILFSLILTKNPDADLRILDIGKNIFQEAGITWKKIAKKCDMLPAITKRCQTR